MIGYIRAILIPMMAVMVLTLVSTGAALAKRLIPLLSLMGKQTKPLILKKPESVFSKATGVTSNTPNLHSG
jgi:hypothetical protein